MELTLRDAKGRVYRTYYIPDEAVTPSFVDDILQETLPLYSTEDEYRARMQDLQRERQQRR